MERSFEETMEKLEMNLRIKKNALDRKEKNSANYDQALELVEQAEKRIASRLKLQDEQCQGNRKEKEVVATMAGKTKQLPSKLFYRQKKAVATNYDQALELVEQTEKRIARMAGKTKQLPSKLFYRPKEGKKK